MKPRNRNWLWFFLLLTVLGGLALGIEIWFNLRQQLTPAKLEQARAKWDQSRLADYDLDLTVTRTTAGPESYRLAVDDQVPGAVTVNGAPLAPQRYPFYDLPGLFERWAELGPRRGAWVVDFESAPAGSRLLHVRVRDGKAVEGFWKDVPGPVPPGPGQRAAVTAAGRPLDRRLLPYYDMNGLFEAIAAQLVMDSQSGGPTPYVVAAFDSGDGHLLRYVHSVRRPRQRIQIDGALHPIK